MRWSWGLAAAALWAVFVHAGQKAPPELGEAFRAGRFGDALSIADSLLRTQPRDPVLWTARGMALGRLGKPQDSLASFDKALAIDARFVPALRGAIEVAYTNHGARAASLLDRLLAIEPADETAHAMAGALSFEAHNCARALFHFERSGAQAESSPAAASQFGSCLIEANRVAEAAALFERALARFPKSSGLRYNLALAQVRAGRAADAVATLRSLVEDGSTDADMLNLFASAQDASGDPNGATVSLERAIKLAPSDDRNYFDLATLCLSHDKPALAVEVAGAGLRRVPNSPRLFTLRGVAHAQLSHFEQAESDFDSALRLKPDQAYTSIARSVLYAHQNDLDKSIALLREQLKSAPNDYTVNFLLGDTLMRAPTDPGSPQRAEARRALQLAVKVRPDSHEAWATLGKLYLQDGETARGVEALETALRLDDSDMRALNQLLIGLRKLNRYDEAGRIAARIRTLLKRDDRSPSAEK